MLHGLLSSALGIVALSLLCSCGIGKKSSDQEKAPTITENVREESSERNEEKNDDKKHSDRDNEDDDRDDERDEK